MVAIGIDLGTANCCVAICRNGIAEIIPNDQGNNTTPSYVAFTQNRTLVGETAKTQATFNPTNTIFGAKRLIGRDYDDLGVQLDVRFWPFKVINENGKPKFLVKFKDNFKMFAPEEVSAMILYRMKMLAEEHLHCKVTGAVITVPAYFNDQQRAATKTAGTIAGFDVLRIMNEPTAAALAFGLSKNVKGLKNILVFDLGGGTLDVSVLTVSKGSHFEVKATAGNTRLGGEDFDCRLASFFAEDFKNKYGKDLFTDQRALKRLRKAAEVTKHHLSSAVEAYVEVPNIFDGIDYHGKITRATFEELCDDLFLDTIRVMKNVIIESGIPKNHIHDVVLVGGSTRIPKIRAMLQEQFDGKQLTTSINPDEAVALGAAIQAEIISGSSSQDVVLIDVVPLSLGIETARGLMFKVIERNTPIPCQKTREITTLDDNQTGMTVEIFEGERSLTRDNNLLGIFELNGIPPAPRGIPKLDLLFDVDANGILRVAVQDRSTGNSNGMEINNKSRYNQNEIEKMIADAEMFKEEDKEGKRCLEARNQLEHYIYNVKQLIHDNKEKISIEELELMTSEIESAVEWLDGSLDFLREEFEAKMTDLMRLWARTLQKISEPRISLFKRRKTDEGSSTPLD